MRKGSLSSSAHLALGALLLVCAPAPLVLALVRQGLVNGYTEEMIVRWREAGIVDGARLAEHYGGDSAAVHAVAAQSLYEVDFAGAGLPGLNVVIGGVVGAVGAAHLVAASRKRTAAPGGQVRGRERRRANASRRERRTWRRW